MKFIVLFLTLAMALAKNLKIKKNFKKAKKQYGIVPGTPVPQQSHGKDPLPLVVGKVPVVDWPLIIPAEDGKNTGRHSNDQVSQLLLNRGLTGGQIKSIVAMIDNDKDGSISDDEWTDFHTLFIAPWVLCDTGKLNVVTAAELTLQQPEFHHLNQLTADEITKLIFVLDQAVSLNFYDYIFLRRVNNAVANCGENYLIIPSNLYCALAITSPRIKKIYTPDEKMMFNSAQILFDGYNRGQRGYMTIIEFISLAQVYNYFNDYEVPFDEGFVYKDDWVKAIQEQMLPFVYTPLYANQMFAEGNKKNFFSLCLSIFAFRMYKGAADPLTGETKSFPERLQWIINQSMVPEQAEVEAASKTYWNLNTLTEDKYLNNFNNLMFLQKKTKLHLKKKNIPADVYTKTAALVITPGAPLIFNLINTYNNDTIRLQEFEKFYRLSLLYLELDPRGIQRINNELLQETRKNQIQTILGKDELQLMMQLRDLLQNRPDFYINYKQFITWFFVKDVFNYLRMGGTNYQAPVTYLVEAFTKLGMRLSHYAVQQSAALFDVQNNQRNLNVKQTFWIAYHEEILAMRNRFVGKLNTPTVP